MLELHIFSAGSFTAAHMPFLFILLQNASHFPIEPWIDSFEAICYVFMYGRYKMERSPIFVPSSIMLKSKTRMKKVFLYRRTSGEEIFIDFAHPSRYTVITI